MSKTAQFALLGVVIAVYAGLVAYFFIRGWRGDAIVMLASIPAIILGIMSDKRTRRCGLFCKPKPQPREQ